MNEQESLQPEDPDEIRAALSRRGSDGLRWILVGIVLLMVVASLLDHLLAPPGISQPFIPLSMAGVALLSYLLLRASPHNRASPLMLVFGMLVFTAWSIYSHGSVRAATTLALLAAVVIAGSHLTLRALWLTTFTGVLLLGGLTWGQANGYLPPANLVADLHYWLTSVNVFLLVGVQLNFNRKASDEVYVRHLNQWEDRIRLEHERDRSMRRFRRVFMLNPTALLVLTPHSEAVVEANPAFDRCFGYHAGQLEGQYAGALWFDENDWLEHRSKLYGAGRTGWQRSLWRHADGQPVEVLISSELTEDQTGMLILTTVMPQPGDD